MGEFWGFGNFPERVKIEFDGEPPKDVQNVYLGLEDKRLVLEDQRGTYHIYTLEPTGAQHMRIRNFAALGFVYMVFSNPIPPLAWLLGGNVVFSVIYRNRGEYGARYMGSTDSDLAKKGLRRANAFSAERNILDVKLGGW